MLEIYINSKEMLIVHPSCWICWKTKEQSVKSFMFVVNIVLTVNARTIVTILCLCGGRCHPCLMLLPLMSGLALHLHL